MEWSGSGYRPAAESLGNSSTCGRALPGGIVPDHAPALHDEVRPLEQAHVLERVARAGDQVRVVTLLDCADAIGPAQQLRGDGRGRPDRIERSHPILDHVAELAGVLAVRVDAAVGPEGHPAPGAERASEVVALQLPDLP